MAAGELVVALRPMTEHGSARLRRLAEELEENGLRLGGSDAVRHQVMEEIDQALRPPVHERRVASTGTVVEPTSDPATWASGTQLDITRTPLGRTTPCRPPAASPTGSRAGSCAAPTATNELIVFDRPAGSERDLGVLASVLDATIVQRHPTGSVRVVGGFGVLRWEGFRWHHEPPVSSWSGAVAADPAYGDTSVLEAMLRFAVHDLGSLGIGALLIYRPDVEPGPTVEERLPTPPPLRIRQASHLAPLRHALAQVDGAAIFDAEGVLRQLGVRLVPSPMSEKTVDALGGTRHTRGAATATTTPWPP